MYIHYEGIMMLQRAKRKKHIPFAFCNAVVSPTTANVNRFEFDEAGAPIQERLLFVYSLLLPNRSVKQLVI